MKKIIGLCLVLALALSFAACGNGNNESAVNSPSETEELSGLNAEVTKTKTGKNAEYTFGGYFTTTVPEEVTAQDNSINSDFTLFAFSQDGITLFDVSFSQRYASEDEVKTAAEEMAHLGSASPADSVKIDGITFHGASMPDYGMTRYIGFVNGYDVTLSVYTDLDNSAWKKFVKHTEFAKQ